MKTGEACDRPRRPFGPLLIDWYRGETLEGRGGSVSRRDHNQLARKRAQLAWGLNSKGKDKSIPSYSSGGGPGEALLLEKRPPPEFPPTQPLREGARGRGFSQRSRLPRSHLTLLSPIPLLRR